MEQDTMTSQEIAQVEEEVRIARGIVGPLLNEAFGGFVVTHRWLLGAYGSALAKISIAFAAALTTERERAAHAVDAALEEAAQIADKHWPESGHVALKHLEPEGAVSCAMSISILIRRLKKFARPETWHGRMEAAEARLREVEGALTFYADVNKYRFTKDDATEPVIRDQGNRARAALAPPPAEPEKEGDTHVPGLFPASVTPASSARQAGEALGENAEGTDGP